MRTPADAPTVHKPPHLDTDLPGLDRSIVVEHVRELLSPAFCRSVVESLGRLGRQRQLPAPTVLLALLHFVMERLPSIQALFDQLTTGRVPGIAPIACTIQALYKRLHTLPHTVFCQAFLQVTHHLAALSSGERSWIRSLAPFATGLYALDDTTLDALVRKTTDLKQFPKGSPQTLGGRLGALIDLSTGRFARVMYDSDSLANEKTHFKPLVEQQPVGGLYVFDLGYFAYPIFDFFTERFSYFVTRLHSRMTFEVFTTLAEGPHYRDRLVWPGKYRADRAAHPVRIVELLVAGRWLSYVTNVLNPTVLTPSAIWALYSQRWTIELTFFAVKRVLGLASLRLSHLNGVMCQVWLTLAVFQLLQELRLATALRLGWHEDDVSWLMLVPLHSNVDRLKALKS
jgi:hypothetical protein